MYGITELGVTGSASASDMLHSTHQVMPPGARFFLTLGPTQQISELSHRFTCAGVSEYTVQPFQVLSLHPRIVVYPGLISNATASVFINQAESRLSHSQLALRKGETADGTKGLPT